MGHYRRLGCVLVFVCAVSAPSFAQTCAGQPSFEHYTWHTTIGLEVVDNGLRAGTSLAVGRDAVFGIGLINTGHAGSRGASYIVGAAVGSDWLIHREGRVHFCPTATGQYTIGPDQGLSFNPNSNASRVDVSSVAFGGGGSVSFVAHATPTRQIVPTTSLSVMRERTRATRQGERFPDVTESFLLTRLGIGFVFDDQLALTPQIVIAFKDPRTTSVHIVGTLSFGLR